MCIAATSGRRIGALQCVYARLFGRLLLGEAEGGVGELSWDLEGCWPVQVEHVPYANYH